MFLMFLVPAMTKEDPELQTYRKIKSDHVDAMRHQYTQSFFGIPAAPAVAVAINDDWEAVLAGYCALIWLVVTAFQLEASLVHLMSQTLYVMLDAAYAIES